MRCGPLANFLFEGRPIEWIKDERFTIDEKPNRKREGYDMTLGGFQVDQRETPLEPCDFQPLPVLVCK